MLPRFERKLALQCRCADYVANLSHSQLSRGRANSLRECVCCPKLGRMRAVHSQQGDIPSLDGLRAFAALWVFDGHAGLKTHVPGPFGVTIFFFLSGYLITTLLRREYEATATISLKKFYLRRVYRILPPMYLVLIVGLILYACHITSGDVRAAGVIAQFAHLTNYYVAFHPSADQLVPHTGVMWSLAVEEHFYLFYPVVLWWLLGRYSYREIALMLLGACVAVFLWRCYLILGLKMGGNYTYVASDARIDSILYGCILGLWSNPTLDADLPRLRAWHWTAILAAAAGVLTFSLLYQPTFRETFEYSLQGLALFPIFYCAVRFPHWPLFRWLNLKWVTRLGLISYTFYLIHPTAIYIASLTAKHHKDWDAVEAFVLAVGFSTASYFLLERRLSALRRRLHPSEAHRPAVYMPAGADPG